MIDDIGSGQPQLPQLILEGRPLREPTCRIALL
jgi:hypothetical protein